MPAPEPNSCPLNVDRRQIAFRFAPKAPQNRVKRFAFALHYCKSRNFGVKVSYELGCEE